MVVIAVLALHLSLTTGALFRVPLGGSAAFQTGRQKINQLVSSRDHRGTVTHWPI